MKKSLKKTVMLTLVAVITSQSLVVGSMSTAKALDLKPSSCYAVAVAENNELGGFELVSKKWVESLKCDAYEYKHVKTGARLIFLDTKNEDKMFSVAFRTPAKDDTGINHIIEHSVLQGSKNYPVKDPFIEMSKRSLNTFLNAMTGADVTMYPVSSKNNKDFQNLMNIYMDAVFYPNLVNDKKIFQEEGWRYEIDSPEGELKYNGIVYNEMKGVYSSPDRLLNRNITQSLFPDTSYKYESGGYPEEMPNLTYEKLVNTYKEYYTPSNSYFYLAGNMDIKSTLKFIGEKYLNNFEKKEVNTKIQVQKPFTERKEKVGEYSISKDTPTKNKTYLSLSYVVGNSTDKDLAVSFSLIKSLLGDTTSSPITKALKDNGFGDAVSIEYENSYAQPVFTITVQNTDESQKDKFQKVVEKTLQDVVNKGFDKELVEGLFNVYEIANRSVKGNFNLAYNGAILQSWIHDGEPTLFLDTNSEFDSLRKKVSNGELQTLIKKYLIDNKHSSLVVLKPVPGLEEKKEAETKAKLAKIKASLSKDELNNLIKENKELKKWQQTPNSKEALSKLPSLTREDINPKAETYNTVEKTENGVKILQHPIYTNGIDYIRMYFDTTKVPQEKLGYIYLLESMFGNTGTEKYSKEDLIKQILTNSGGISVGSSNFVKNSDKDIYHPKMMVSITSLKDKTPKNFELVQEILFNSKLNDKAQIKESITNMKTMMESQVSSDGNMMAMQKIMAYMSESGKYNNYIIEEYYKFLCDLEKNFDKNSDEIVKNLEEVRNLIFNKQDLIASYTGEEKDYANFAKNFNNFANNLKNEKLKSHEYKFDSSQVNEGIIVPSKVQYVFKGGDLKKAGYDVSGKMLVLANILEGGYLWNNIRIQGGAYGTGVRVDGSNVIFSSYRDPNLKETLNTIDGIPEYLKNFDASEEEMTNYIIGTIGKMDNATNMMKALLGPVVDGMLGDAYYMSEIKAEDLQKQREQIITTKSQDIRDFAKVVDALLKQDYLCVVGGETKIKENEENFAIIKDITDSKKDKSRFVDLEKKENVDTNKQWGVKFSKELDTLTVNTSNVYVLDDQNHQVEIKVSYDKKNKAIIVKPKKLYEKGKKYTLYIKGIQSVEKEEKIDKLVTPVKMEFVTKK